MLNKPATSLTNLGSAVNFIEKTENKKNRVKCKNSFWVSLV